MYYTCPAGKFQKDTINNRDRRLADSIQVTQYAIIIQGFDEILEATNLSCGSMKRTFILHPFLFTIYAILAPLARNIDAVGLSAIRTMVISLFWVILLSILFRWIVKDQAKAGLLLSGLVVLFFTYGRLDALLAQVVAWAGASLVLLVAFIFLYSLWSAWVLRKSTRLPSLTNYLNLVGLILIVFPLYQILTYSRQETQFEPLAQEFQQEIWQQSGLAELKAGSGLESQPRPDIYYIILDGYTRTDVLQELFGYDNSEFLRALERRGFYVARHSRSNYTDTVYSISSSLNMSHVNSLPDYLRPKMAVNDQKALQDILSVLVKQNRVRSFLAQQGYEFVNFDSSYDRINIPTAEHFEKSPDIGRFNPQAAFDLMVLNTTLGKAYFRLRGEENGPLQSLFDEHRTRIRYTLASLPKYAGQAGDYFIYAHIISPHAPYVFGPNGEERNGVDPFTLLDNPESEEWTPDLYRDQVIYISKMILDTLDQILAQSDTRPIIILQADHSNRAYDVVGSSSELKMKLLFPILNAYLLPGLEKDSPVYPTITPVNSFRLVFNNYFGTRLDLLDDTSYVLENRQGQLQFVDACAEYQACAP